MLPLVYYPTSLYIIFLLVTKRFYYLKIHILTLVRFCHILYTFLLHIFCLLLYFHSLSYISYAMQEQKEDGTSSVSRSLLWSDYCSSYCISSTSSIRVCITHLVIIKLSSLYKNNWLLVCKPFFLPLTWSEWELRHGVKFLIEWIFQFTHRVLDSLW